MELKAARRQPRKSGWSKITKGKINPMNTLFFLLFLGSILFAALLTIPVLLTTPIISCASVSCKTGFTVQCSGLLHLFSRSCTQISSVLPMQDVLFHFPLGETIVSVFMVCADNHRSTLAGKSCPESEWHLALKVGKHLKWD